MWLRVILKIFTPRKPFNVNWGLSRGWQWFFERWKFCFIFIIIIFLCLSKWKILCLGEQACRMLFQRFKKKKKPMLGVSLMLKPTLLIQQRHWKCNILFYYMDEKLYGLHVCTMIKRTLKTLSRLASFKCMGPEIG
jgi:hypothetical protein